MNNRIFEQIKQMNEYGAEYWSARNLYKVLEYAEYRYFESVIERARMACKNSKQPIADHFVDMHDMVKIGSGAERQISDVQLSRYACYLIIQNADPAKEVVALGQTYFTIQTRKQELTDQLLEDQKRVYLREEMKTHNKTLAKSAQEAGVVDYAVFQDYGYMGLYGGLRQKDIHTKKKLKPSEKILDHMGSEELAANLFRATQTDAKLKRENIKGQSKANQAHLDVGKKVRQTIKDLGGTMPEKLPTAEHVKESVKRVKKLIK